MGAGLVVGEREGEGRGAGEGDSSSLSRLRPAAARPSVSGVKCWGRGTAKRHKHSWDAPSSASPQRWATLSACSSKAEHVALEPPTEKAYDGTPSAWVTWVPEGDIGVGTGQGCGAERRQYMYICAESNEAL